MLRVRRLVDRGLEAALILSGKRGVTVRSVEAAMYEGGDGRRDTHGAEGMPSHPEGRYSFLGSEREERARILEALLRSRGNKTRLPGSSVWPAIHCGRS